MACGAGFYWAAVLATAVALFSLGPLRLVSRRVLDRPHERRLEVELEENAGAAAVLRELEASGSAVRSLALADTDGKRVARITVDLPHGAAPDAVLVRLGELEEVRAIQWLA